MASYPIGKAVTGLMVFPSMTQSSLCNSRRASFLLTGQGTGFTSSRKKKKSHSWKPDQLVCPVTGLLVDTSQTAPPVSFSRNWGGHSGALSRDLCPPLKGLLQPVSVSWQYSCPHSLWGSLIYAVSLNVRLSHCSHRPHALSHA